MANRILSDFFYGNLAPSEKQYDRNSEFGKVIDELAKEEATLRAMLDADALAALERLVHLQGNLHSMTAEGYYIDGFRTGFRLATAVFYDGEQNFLRALSEES